MAAHDLCLHYSCVLQKECKTTCLKQLQARTIIMCCKPSEEGSPGWFCTQFLVMLVKKWCCFSNDLKTYKTWLAYAFISQLSAPLGSCCNFHRDALSRWWMRTFQISTFAIAYVKNIPSKTKQSTSTSNLDLSARSASEAGQDNAVLCPLSFGSKTCVQGWHFSLRSTHYEIFHQNFMAHRDRVEVKHQLSKYIVPPRMNEWIKQIFHKLKKKKKKTISLLAMWNQAPKDENVQS